MQGSEVSGNLKVLACGLAICLLLLLPIAASAQESGAILGVIRDTSGGVVPNARVTVTNTGTAVARTVTTGADGAYRVPALQPGIYSVKVEAQGFETTTLTALNLHVAEELVSNATLRVGAATQEVTVTGEAPVVNTTTSSIGNLVSDQTIAELPLNGRNYTDLTLLAPGVVAATHSGLGDAGTWYSSNGAPPRSNNYTLDGALTVTKNGTGPASSTGNALGVDGIREYKVVTSMFSAEYGLLMGSQMVVVSKGGSNKWSGSVFEYLRNNHLDARNFFDPQPWLTNNILVDASGNLMRNPQFKRNNFGASFGGPIQKDKTFFFLVYEGVRMVQGDTIQDTTMAAACHFWNVPGVGNVIAGGGPIPSTVTLPAGFSPSNQVIIDGFSRTAFAGATLADLAGKPAGTVSACGGVKVPDSGVVPTVSTVVQPWVGQFPFPNQVTTAANQPNYTFPGFTRARDDYAQLRVDHNFSANDTFFTRYTFIDGVIHTPYSNGNLSGSATGIGYPQFPIEGLSRNQYITLGENHIFSPTLLNSFRLSFSRTIYTNLLIEANDPGLNPDFLLKDPEGSSCVTSGTNCIWSYVPAQTTGGINPGSGVTGISAGGTFPNYHATNTWTLGNDVFYTRGKHGLKFGVLINRMNQPHLQSKSVRGGLSFSNIGNFLAAVPSNFNIVGPGKSVALDPTSFTNDLLAPPFNGRFIDRNFTWFTYGFYLQDDYRATPRLTLNLGLRYEFRTDLHEQYNRESYIPDMHTSTQAQVGFEHGLITNPTYKNWSPRLGFAWDIRGNGKTAIRGGFGIYFDVGNYGALLTQSSTGIPPFISNTTFFNTGSFSIDPGCTPSVSTSTCLSLPLSAGATGAGKSLQGNDYNARSPHSMQYNLTVEQQLPLGVGLAVSYVGRRSLNLYTGMEGNPVVPDHFDSAGNPVYNVENGQVGCLNNSLSVDANGVPQPFTLNGVAMGPTDTITVGGVTGVPYPCRVNPYWTSALFYTNAASAWYNSMQVAVNKRLSRGLMFQTAYTWSRATDTTQGTRFNDDCGGAAAAAFGRNPYNIAKDYGVSCYDVTHAMHFNLLYHLPTIQSNGFLSKVVNGWWVGNLVTVQGGNAFTPIVNQDRSFSGIVSQQSRMYASLNTEAYTVHISGKDYNFIPFNPDTVITGDPLQWFNPLMFGEAPLGQGGNVPRNYLRGPGLGSWDFSLVKDTKLGFLGEGGNLQFRAEFFNILNRANFDFINTGASVFAGNTSINSFTPVGGSSISCNDVSACPIQAPLSSAGQITSTATNSRQIQFALRVSF
jgi:hypothetical protein